jgi:hypothetical protein
VEGKDNASDTIHNNTLKIASRVLGHAFGEVKHIPAQVNSYLKMKNVFSVGTVEEFIYP